MNNQSSQQIAEQLARNCNNNWYSQPIEHRPLLTNHILQSIPLVELLELMELSLEMNEVLGWRITDSKLLLLDTKLKQILGEQDEP